MASRESLSGTYLCGGKTGMTDELKENNREKSMSKS